MVAEFPKLLLVEEEPVLAEITAFRLELLGYEVRCVRSGEQALQAIQESPPELIILDPALPDMDGIDLINRLSSEMATSKIPILVASVDATLETVELCYHAGARDYLVTPYDPAVLQHKLEALLQDCVTGN